MVKNNLHLDESEEENLEDSNINASMARISDVRHHYSEFYSETEMRVEARHRFLATLKVYNSSFYIF